MKLISLTWIDSYWFYDAVASTTTASIRIDVSGYFLVDRVSSAIEKHKNSVLLRVGHEPR